MDLKEIVENTKLFLFDMDGTLYLGNHLFDFTKDLLQEIRRKGADYLFVTNNSSKSVNDYVKKMQRLGIDCEPDDFLTSSQATVYYLKKHHPHAVIYVCGTQSLKQEIRDNGFTVTENLDDVDCIVIGNDTELTFQKLEDVCRLLTQRELPYIATNPDYVCPCEFGSVPDCGSFCDMIAACTGKRPVVIGKPSPLMTRLAIKAAGVRMAQATLVGDRIYTDIKAGINAGAKTILVMTGETTPALLQSSLDKPDTVIKSGAEILSVLRCEN